MSARSENFYASLNTEADLTALINKSEDADFDCKIWPTDPTAERRVVAKAACAFTNATGGVIILGMDARKPTGGDVDVVQSLQHVADANVVQALALTFIGESVDTGIEGVHSKTIFRDASMKEGYVIIHVPESEDAPRRTKTDWKFYVRISTGTQPMEMFQIADRFGRRPHPKLVIVAKPAITMSETMYPAHRLVAVSLRNDGRGLARFPCMRLRNMLTSPSPFTLPFSPVLTPLPVWPLHSSDGWQSVRGGRSPRQAPHARTEAFGSDAALGCDRQPGPATELPGAQGSKLHSGLSG